jgi:quercetin dioxygenase-like cupin family protein
VRVTRWTLEVQESTGVHHHAYDYVVVPMSAGRMRIVGLDGSESTAELAPGRTYFREAGVEHNVWNAGEGVLDFVEVELLTRGASEPRASRGGDDVEQK